MAELSDNDLWEILQWRPEYCNAPSRSWIGWAKVEITNITWTGEQQTAGRLDADCACVVKMMAIAKTCYEFTGCGDGYGDNGFRRDLLAAMVEGAYYAAHPEKVGIASPFERGVRLASAQNYVRTTDIDEWRPGMESGTGWKKYISLNHAGSIMATSVFKHTQPSIDSKGEFSGPSFINNNQVNVAINVPSPNPPPWAADCKPSTAIAKIESGAVNIVSNVAAHDLSPLAEAERIRGETERHRQEQETERIRIIMEATKASSVPDAPGEQCNTFDSKTMTTITDLIDYASRERGKSTSDNWVRDALKRSGVSPCFEPTQANKPKGYPRIVAFEAVSDKARNE